VAVGRMIATGVEVEVGRGVAMGLGVLVGVGVTLALRLGPQAKVGMSVSKTSRG